MGTKKLTVVPMREQIYKSLKNAIITNEYKPGELLQIDHLAKEFGVSIIPVREALIHLEDSGLLTLIPNKGALVTDYDEADVVDCWEMRKILEPYAGKICATLDINREIVALEKRIKDFLKNADDLHEYIEIDKDLHELLYVHLPNKMLRQTIEKVLQNSLRMRYFAEGISNSQSLAIVEVCEEHLAILKALKQKDSKAAKEIIYQHIVNSERRTLSSVQKNKR